MSFCLQPVVCCFLPRRLAVWLPSNCLHILLMYSSWLHGSWYAIGSIHTTHPTSLQEITLQLVNFTFLVPVAKNLNINYWRAKNRNVFTSQQPRDKCYRTVNMLESKHVYKSTAARQTFMILINFKKCRSRSRESSCSRMRVRHLQQQQHSSAFIFCCFVTWQHNVSLLVVLSVSSTSNNWRDTVQQEHRVNEWRNEWMNEWMNHQKTTANKHTNSCSPKWHFVEMFSKFSEVRTLFFWLFTSPQQHLWNLPQQ